ncbi:MAG: hypothetical protein MK116_10610 [Phycisphaerales bacterium]|nr:hypothetical protein [Phycisphaerales bacterium]
MFKHLSSCTSIVVIALISLTGTGQVASAQDMAMPKSMNEFVNWHLDRGACGNWLEAGVTKDMWVGIPAGISYTNTNNLRYDPASDQLFHTHHMVTSNGDVLSTGSGLMYWNADINAPMSCSAGFDRGKPYTGISVLKGMTDDTIYWEYTEKSQGKTTTYTNTITYTTPTTRRQTVAVADGRGEPWVTNLVRANPGGDLLKQTRLAGTWRGDMPGGATQVREISWLADAHVLKQERTVIQADGSRSLTDLYLMYWDPVNDHIATMYLDDHGTVIHGKIDSITTDGDTVTIVSSHEGSRFGNLTMSTQMTQVVTDETLTTTFQGMALDGKRHGLSWSEDPNVSRRVN